MKGYTETNFVEFLNLKRKNGNNVDNWLFKELLKEIENFKRQKKNAILNQNTNLQNLQNFEDSRIF